MIDDILYQHFIRRGVHEYITDIAFILLFSLGAAILFSLLTPLRATVYLSVSLFVYFWFSYFLFSHYFETKNYDCSLFKSFFKSLLKFAQF